MATIGSLVIGLSLGTAGLAMGLNNVESQLKAFQNRVNGQGAMTAQAAAYERVKIAQEQVVLAQQQLNVSTLRLSELQAIASTRASTLAAAQLTVTRNTHALAAAQKELAAAQLIAAAPVATGQMGGHFPYITAAATIAGYALLQFSINSARAAAAFEYEMRLIQTQAGATRQEVVALSDAVLQMAPGLQTGPQELAKVMFRLKSVGMDNAEALEAMRLAAMGARVGNASLDSVTNAMIATMTSGIEGIDNFEHAMGLLNATVGVSNLRMEDLTGSLSSGILSTARQFGLEFIDVGAALAAMSDQAIPAEEGATRLRISIALLAAPTDIAGRELAKIGLTERALADQMRGPGGLIGALTLLKERMEAAGLDATEQSMLLKTAFGGSRSSAGILTLMNSLDLLQEKYTAIQSKSGTFMEDWAAQSETASAHFATFGAVMDVLSVRIGNGLMPAMIGLATVIGFVADKTIIVVPLFYLIITAISIALVKAVWGAIAGLVKLAGTMVVNGIAAVAMKVAFANMGPVIAGNMAIAGGGVAAFNAQMAAANLNAAGFVPVMGSVNAAMAGGGAAAGPLVAGLATANGAMAATAASSAPLVAGLSGASGAMAATAAASGPLVTGLAGASGAMAAGAASSGPLVAGLAGAGGAMAAASASTGPLITGLAGASGAMAATTASSGALILPLSAVGPAGVAGAAGVGALGTASAAASPAVWSLAGAINLAISPVWILIAAITLVVGAIALLVLNFDRVMQGLRMVDFGFQSVKVAVLDFLASIPFVGEAFKGAAQQAHEGLERIRSDVAAAEADIASKAADGGFDPFGDFSAQVQAQIDAAILQAQGGFNDLNETLIDLYGTSMAGVQAAARVAGTKDMQEYAKGIADAQDLPKNAFIDLLNALETELTPEAEAARLIGQLQSKELADGLASGSPRVVATAEALKKSIIDRLDEISDGAYSASQMTWEQWLQGWKDAQMAAGGASSEITMQLKLSSGMPELRAEFDSLKSQWADSLAPTAEEARAAMDALRLEVQNGTASVNEAAKAFVDQFGYNLSALKDIGQTAGADMMLAIADEISNRQDAVMNSIAGLHEVLTDGMSAATQQAFLLAALYGDEIVNGLASKEPDVYARAVASRDLIIQQLDFLSNGQFSRGQQAFVQWSQGYVNAAGFWVPPQTGPMPNNTLGLTADQLAQGKSDYQKYLESLSSSNSSFVSQYKSDMTSAFAEIRAKALEYFDAVHDKTIKAIEDARDHKNALLDAKAALNQGPVDAAQRALDAQRKAIQEWRLREAVRTASSPEEYRDAILALNDFLAQKKIDQMQAEADAANDVIAEQKKANDEQAQARIDAENARYEQQKKDFQRNLTALERYLKNHPEAWRRTQNEIMALLNEYGVTYKNTGNLLGKEFADGLRDQVGAAKAAGDALANAAGQGIKETADGIAAVAAAAAAVAAGTVGAGWGFMGQSTQQSNADLGVDRRLAMGGPVYKGQPTWVGEVGKELFVPQTNGYVLNHADSLRALAGLEPAASPVSLDAIRRATERPEVRPINVRADVATSKTPEGVLGGGTVIFQVGDAKLGELTDRALARQTAVYGGRKLVSNRSVR